MSKKKDTVEVTEKPNTWELTDEHRAKIPAWNKNIIDNVIRRTKPLTDEEKVKVEASIRAMYNLANLDGENLKVLFVPSPLMAAIVAGAAAAWWFEHDEKEKALKNMSGTAKMVMEATVKAASK